MENGQQPAFPSYNHARNLIENEGLSKRELIAAMAMQGLLASGEHNNPDMKNINEKRAISEYSTQMADELLKSLNP